LDAGQETVVKIRTSSSNMTASYVSKLLRARDPALVERLLGALETAGLPAGTVPD
jgi:hypothetical protein